MTKSRLALVLPVAFLLLATFYSVANPPFEAPDEVGHFDYVLHLLTERTLPRQRANDLGEAQQPPLYYVIAAMAALPSSFRDPTGSFQPNPAFIWASNGGREINAGIHGSVETFPFVGQALTLHLAREASVVMGALTIWLIVMIGWGIFPERPGIGILAGAIAAFDPQFLFIGASVNNDNLLALTATGAIWQMVRMVGRPDRVRDWIYLGLWVSAAVLAKPTGAVIGLVAGVVLLVGARRRCSLAFLARRAVALGAAPVVTTGWWFARNQLLYGDPLGWTVFQKIFAADMRQGPLQWSDLHEFATVQFRSFWGVFGWMNVDAPGWFYLGTRIFCALAVAGLAFALLSGRRFKAPPGRRAALALLALAIVAQQGYMLWYITRCNGSCYQGRYLFPVIGATAVLLAVGLLAAIPPRWDRLVVGGIGTVLIGVAIYLPLAVIQPAYHVVALPSWELRLIPRQTDLVFGRAFALRGYRVDRARDGSAVVLTLYWQAVGHSDFDYSAFAHLIDRSGRLIAQQDHAPGADEDFLPTHWQVGDIVADRHVIPLPKSANPAPYQLRIGLYNWQTGARLPVQGGHSDEGTFVILGDQILP